MSEGIFNLHGKGMRRNYILRQVSNDESLPILPQILTQLEELIQDPDTHASEIAKLIESEPVIAGRVLKLANSAYYASGRSEVHGIQMAVNRLGFETIRQLVYSVVLPNLFDLPDYFYHEQFWRHSFTVATMTRELLEKFKGGDVEEEDLQVAYLAGLMHDIGVLVFISAIPEEYQEATDLSRDAGIGLDLVEENAFGISHSELGGFFVEKSWELDERMVRIIREHHTNPKNTTTRDPVHECLFVANLLCNVYKLGNGILADYSQHNLQMLAAVAELGYDVKQVERVLQEVNESLEFLDSLLADQGL